MKRKLLSFFGLKMDLKVVNVRPTNISVVRMRKPRMHNLFKMEDGSVAILDYESDYRNTDASATSYLCYECGRPTYERKKQSHMIILVNN